MATELSPMKRAKAPVYVAPPESSDRAALICGAIVLLSFLPIFLLHAQRLWALPHYQFFPFLLLGSLVIAWSRWREAGPLERGDAMITLVGIAASWAIFAMAEVVLSSTLGVVAALVLLAVLLYGAGGWPFLRLQLPAWLLLWMAVPLPFGLDSRLVLSMQTVTSRCSSWVLDFLGVYHQLSGNVVEIAGNRLLVEEACAGVNSLFSLVACCLFLIFYLRRSWVRALLLIVATLGWVLVCNVVRVTMIAIAADRWHYDLANGWRHDVLGFACFALAVILIWSTDRFFLFLKPEWTKDSAPIPSAQAGSETPIAGMFAGLAGVLSWPVAVAFGLLLAFHLGIHGSGLMEAFRSDPILPTIAQLGDESLPKKLGKWDKNETGYVESTRNPGNSYGEFSKSWNYSHDLLGAQVSLDYPFPGFHDLKGCYMGGGFDVEKEIPHQRDPKMPDHVYYTEVKLRHAFKHGYLLFAIADSKGKILEPEPAGLSATVSRYEKALKSLKSIFTKGQLPEPDRPHGAAYQFQTFVESNAPFTDEEQLAVRELFFEATRTLHNKVFPPEAK